MSVAPLLQETKAIEPAEGEQIWESQAEKLCLEKNKTVGLSANLLAGQKIVAHIEEVTPISTFSLGDSFNDNLKELFLIELHSHKPPCAWGKKRTSPSTVLVQPFRVINEKSGSQGQTEAKFHHF